jgi:NAD(P)H-dependent FMN reductase
MFFALVFTLLVGGSVVTHLLKWVCCVFCFMIPTPQVLAFSGSARRDSLNKKLLAAAVQAVREAGAEVTLVDLNEYELPLYHGDLEDTAGLPANATKLIELITRHHALLVASPEYNSMITPLLKNTIDWCTRGDGNPFDGKAAAIVSASPGALGGIRSLQLAQQLLLKLGCHVVPRQTTLSHADKAFDANGQLTDARALKSVKDLAAVLVETTRKFRATAA